MTNAKWRNERWLKQRLLEVKFSEGDALTLCNWVRAADRIKPVLFVGAGWSRNALGPPHRKPLTWAELAARLRQDMPLREADTYVDPLWLAELYQQQHGANALAAVLEQAVPDQALLPGPLHTALTGIQWQSVLTTNYDTLLERAFDADMRVRVCVDDEDLTRSAQQDELELIHLHGVIHRPNTIVLAFEDYRQYPTLHPGMVAKVRQLFLQHPVLFVGFGVTDPNFLQWSGWLSDVVGDRANPWLSLTHGEPPPLSQRNYWGRRLSFVPLPSSGEGRHEAVLSLFDILTQALEKPDRRTRKDAETRLRSHSKAVDVVKELRDILELAEQREGRDADLAYFIRSAFNIAASHVLDLAPPTPQPELSASPSTTERDIDAEGPDPPRIAATAVRDLIHRAFGADAWRAFAELLSLHLRTATWHFHYQSQKGSLSKEMSATFRVEPRLHSTDEERALIQLHLGQALALPSLPKSPRAHRLVAFNAFQSCNYELAAAHYSEGARLARSTNEPLRVELKTLESLAQCLFILHRDDELDVVRRQIHRGEMALSRMPHEETHWHSYAEKLAGLRKLVAGLLERRQGDHQNLTFTAEWATAESELYRLESEWFAPTKVADAAGTLGMLQWLDGDWIGAAQTLIRYSDQRLSSLVQVDILNGTLSTAQAQDLAEELLRAARWPGEYLAKVETLTKILPVCLPSQIERVAEFAESARAVTPTYLPIARSGGIIFPWVAREAIELLEQSTWRWLGPEKAIDAVLRWRMRINKQVLIAADHPSGELHKSHWRHVRRLPWKDWVFAGLRRELVENFLVDATRGFHEGSTANSDWSSDELADLLLDLADDKVVSVGIGQPMRALLDRALEGASEPVALRSRAWLAFLDGDRRTAESIVAQALERFGEGSAQDKLNALGVAIAGRGCSPESLNAFQQVAASTLRQAIEVDGRTSILPMPFGKMYAGFIATSMMSPHMVVRNYASELQLLVLARIPESVEELARVSTARLGKGAQRVTSIVREFLRGAVPTTVLSQSSQRSSGIRSVWRRLLHQGSGDVPNEWIAELTLLSRAGERSLAERATWVLSEWLRHLRTSKGPGLWNSVCVAVEAAALDERPGVRACGLRAQAELLRLEGEKIAPPSAPEAVCFQSARSGVAFSTL